MQRHGELFDQRGGFEFGIADCAGGGCAEKLVEKDDTGAAGER